MADYQAHCTWGRFSSKAGCESLADRLGDVEHPSRDELLALVWSRNELRGAASLSRAEACSVTEAIVAEHPDYADALFLLSRCAVMGLRKVGDDDAVALLLRAAKSEPDNYLVLKHLTSQWSDIGGIIDLGALAAYRESLYAAAKGRVDWRRAVLPKGAVATETHLVWTELYDAAQGIHAAALREGDLDAAEALQVRFRRDAGLDELGRSVDARPRQSPRLVRLGGRAGLRRFSSRGRGPIQGADGPGESPVRRRACARTACDPPREPGAIEHRSPVCRQRTRRGAGDRPKWGIFNRH